jgi:hypothetical protein
VGQLQYRLGRIPEALESLERAAAINLEQGTPYHPLYDIAFRAMCHHRLGETSKAHALLDSIDIDEIHPDNLCVVTEAETLLAGEGD